MRNNKMITTEQQQKYQHCHHAKLVNMNFFSGEIILLFEQ